MASLTHGAITFYGVEQNSLNKHMTGFRASASPEGDAALINVTYSSSAAVSVIVPFYMMSIVSHEIRSAAMLMTYRQRLKLDRGHEALMELCATALTPASIDFVVDPKTLDKLMVVQFAENSPVCLRISAEAMAACLEKLARLNGDAH